jgi:hypothetical protein
MTSTVTSRLMGDPPPGRSAQDQIQDGPLPSMNDVLGRLEPKRPSQPASNLPSEPPVLHAPPQPPGSEDAAATPPAAQPPPPEGNPDQSPTCRLVEAIVLHHDGSLSAPPTDRPVFMDVDPRSLLIEASYQRELSDKSLTLIRKIATAWDWRRFRPPVVVMSDDGGLILDGQHTAIAAASRGDLPTIPIMLVDAADVRERAAAFVGLNKDRLALTPMQLHHAAVAAGDEAAVTVEQVCGRAGVTLVRAMYGGYRWKPGDTYAIGAIRSLVDRRGAMVSRQLLEILAKAPPPIGSHDVKAVEFLFTDPDHRDQLEPLAGEGAADVLAAISATAATAERDAKVLAASLCVPLWKALAITWFKKSRKRRKV